MSTSLPNIFRRGSRPFLSPAPLQALAASLAVILGIATQRPAQAQRPVRLTLGGSVGQQSWSGYSSSLFQTGYGNASSNAAVFGASYDVMRIHLAGDGEPLVASVYYDRFSYSTPLFGVVSAPSAWGIGLSARRKDDASSFYYGAGAGIYRVDWHGTEQGNDPFSPTAVTPNQTALGAKLFTGLQGRGSLFLEFGTTALVSSRFQPVASLLVGMRL